MALIEAVLTYRTVGTSNEGSVVPLGRTADPVVLRAVRDRVLAEAWAEAEVWRRIDPGVFVLRAAEAERLARVLDAILPNGPHLSLVGEGDA